MSLYKVDGHFMSVDEFYTWCMGFVVLYRKGRLEHKKLPGEVHEIMKDPDDKKVGKALMAYLKGNEDYMNDFIKLVQDGIMEMAVEKDG